MELFNQPLKRTIGRSTSLATPKFTMGLEDRDDGWPISPLKESQSFSFNVVKTCRPPGRCWNILKTPKRSPSTTVKSKKAISALENDTDRSMSPIEEWNNENDDVNLLPPQKTPSIESVVYPSDGEGFDVASSSSLSPLQVDTKRSEFSAQQHSLTPAMLSGSGFRSQKMWNRISSSYTGKNHVIHDTKKKKSRKEIEIQFESFFEEDDDSQGEEFLSSPTPPVVIDRSWTKKPNIRRSSALHSWLTKTVGAVKWGYTSPAKRYENRNSTEPQGTNSSEPIDDDDDENQIQISFEKIDSDFSKRSSKHQLSNNLEDDVTVTFSPDWDKESPAQFLIPNDIAKPSVSWDCEEDCHLEHSHDIVVKNASNSTQHSTTG